MSLIKTCKMCKTLAKEVDFYLHRLHSAIEKKNEGEVQSTKEKYECNLGGVENLKVWGMINMRRHASIKSWGRIRNEKLLTNFATFITFISTFLSLWKRLVDANLHEPLVDNRIFLYYKASCFSPNVRHFFLHMFQSTC